MITEKAIHTLVTTCRLRNSELEFRRIPLEAEEHLMSLIRQGKYKEIHLSPFAQLDDNLGLMADKATLGHTYLVVSSIALFSRVVIGAGVLPDDSFDLSDALLYALSHCKTSREIHEIYQLAAVMFAKQVYQQINQKPSYQIERILNYISRNIYNKITLEAIAKYVGLSPNYLSSLFSQEMGMSLHNYIQREKVSIACNLLMHTDRSISDISAYMGFQTQSNFSLIFRKWKNMTPTEFRKINYREVY